MKFKILRIHSKTTVYALRNDLKHILFIYLVFFIYRLQTYNHLKDFTISKKYYLIYAFTRKFNHLTPLIFPSFRFILKYFALLTQNLNKYILSFAFP
jgi:hypothetical protein